MGSPHMPQGGLSLAMVRRCRSRVVVLRVVIAKGWLLVPAGLDRVQQRLVVMPCEWAWYSG
jgi:hypothetical protein